MSFYLKTQFSYPKITLESFLSVYPKAFSHTTMAGIKKKTKITVLVNDTCHRISSNMVKRRSLTHLLGEDIS